MRLVTNRFEGCPAAALLLLTIPQVIYWVSSASWCSVSMVLLGLSELCTARVLPQRSC